MKRGNSTGARRSAHPTICGLTMALTLLAGVQLGGQPSVSLAEAAPVAGTSTGSGAAALPGAFSATSTSGAFEDASQPSLGPNGEKGKAREVCVPGSSGHLAYCLYVPAGLSGAATTGPRAIARPPVAVLALHGIGGNGEEMLAAVRASADALGWAVIAPTVSYGDWRDPDQLLREELWLQPQLLRLIDEAFRDAGVAAPGSVVVFGFSRGAQAAARLALLYPERISAVASLSGGAYTLPVGSVSASGSTLAAPLPYGIADFEQRIGRAPNVSALRHVRFWVGVGTRDTGAGDVPRQWDPFEGSNRVERAQRFAAAAAQMSSEVQLVLLPNTAHELTPAAVSQAFHFLAAGFRR